MQHICRHGLGLDKKGVSSICIGGIEEKMVNASFYCFIVSCCRYLFRPPDLRSVVFDKKKGFSLLM